MVRVDVIYASEDGGLVEDFLRALRANGIEAHVPAGPPEVTCPLVVLITPSLLTPVTAAAAEATARGYDEVLPVSFLPGASDNLFKNLSQSLISKLGVEECARRVATIARYGGRAIVSWNNLVSRAQRWHAEGNAALLPASDITSALTLMQSPPAQASDRREVVGQFVAASQAAVNRRKRIGVSVVAVAALLLVAVLVFATVQAVGARVAQGRADESSNTATSNRLAQAAIDIILGNPDLPAILVQRAFEAAVTPTAQEASARVAAGNWPHESYELGYSPVGVSAAATSPRLAVTDTEREEIVVYEGPGGAELGRFGFSTQSGVQGGRGRLSPDGTRLLTRVANRPGADGTATVANAIKLFEVDSGEQVVGPNRWQHPDDLVFEWLDDDRALVGRGNQILSIDPASGDARPFATFPVGEIIDSGSMSRNRRYFVAASSQSLAVIDVSSGTAVHSMPTTTLRDPIVSDDGRSVVAIESPNAITIDFSSDEPETTTVPVGPNVLLPLDGPYAFVGGMSGELSVVAMGVDTEVQTVRGHLSDRVRATRLPDGRIATVGQDGYLRVWSVPSSDTLGRPTSTGFVSMSARLSDATGVDIPPRASARNQIRLTPDGYVAVSLLPGNIRILRPDDLETTEKEYFAGLDTDVFLSRNGVHIGRVAGNRTNTFPYDESQRFWTDKGSREMPGTDIRMAIAMGGPGVAAVSDDGATVLVADGHSLTAYSNSQSPSEEATFIEQRTPVGLWANDQRGQVLTADGYLRVSDGTETALAIPASGEEDESPRVAAAEFTGSGEVVFATRLGDLYRSTSAGIAAIGSIGPGNDTFAVRISRDGSRAALIGRTGVVVVDMADGATTYSGPAHGKALVTDVDFSADNQLLYLVNELGAVHRVDLRTATSQTRPPAPRDYTSEEHTLFETTGDRRG